MSVECDIESHVKDKTMIVEFGKRWEYIGGDKENKVRELVFQDDLTDRHILKSEKWIHAWREIYIIASEVLNESK